MQNDHIDPADLINENNPNLWDFEILDGVSFMNCNRIHPLKQKEIQKLVNSCAEDNGLDALIIFGSSVEFRCNSKSDIDMVYVDIHAYRATGLEADTEYTFKVVAIDKDGKELGTAKEIKQKTTA